MEFAVRTGLDCCAMVALSELSSIFSDVHAARKNEFDFISSPEVTKLCETFW